LEESLFPLTIPDRARGKKEIACRMRYEGGEGIESSNSRQEAIRDAIGSPRNSEVQKNRESHVKNFYPLYDPKNRLPEPV